MSVDKIATAYGQVFNSSDGEVVIKDLMEQFMMRSSIVPGDPYVTHAKEGAREVILYIHDILEDYNNG